MARHERQPVEPGPMLAILPLQLTIEARIVRRTVQHEYCMGMEQLLHIPGGMSRGAIHAQDQWRAVQLEVTPERSYDQGRIVVLAAGERGAIGDTPIGRDERELMPFNAALMHRVQSPQHPGVRDPNTIGIFGLAVLMVFLILAAQYERLTLPLAVIMAVPFAVFGAFVAVWARGLYNDLYLQIGLVTLVGLAAKNAILIVEFAAHMHREQNMSLVDAAVEAARLRFRPIVMTSLAFILGVLPLAVSRGAGAASRHSIGTGVIGGMLAATFIAVLFIPLFFVVTSRLAEIARAYFARVRHQKQSEA